MGDKEATGYAMSFQEAIKKLGIEFNGEEYYVCCAGAIAIEDFLAI